MEEKKRKTLRDARDASTSSEGREAESTSFSCVSMKSDRSMFVPITFEAKMIKSQVGGQTTTCSVCEQDLKDPVRLLCGHQSCKLCVTSDSPVKQPCPECGAHVQRNTDEDSRITNFLKTKKRHKKAMQKKFAFTSEGNGDQQSSLSSVYTTLFVTSQQSEGPHREHPLRDVEFKLRKRPSSDDTNLYITTGDTAEADAGHEFRRGEFRKMDSWDTTVGLNDIFSAAPGRGKPSRTALTKGVAGIGKSFAVQKLILDWAEEQTDQDTDFIFCLAFRELNLSKGEKSLHTLLTDVHPALSDLTDADSYVQSKTLVILDGLDESRLQLDFAKTKAVRSVSTAAPLGDLLVNLIQGNLLPDARLWITSRPAAASQIPAQYIDTVTEIRGFSDPQKDEYFRRRFSHDPSLAERIIAHVQSSPSLSSMCQIPIFCWISTVLFEDVFTADDKDTIPQTLTEMMAHFLFAQTKRRSRKYDQTEENDETFLERHREFLLKLSKLAFVHLQKNNLIFYEVDLQQCGIDVKEAAIYSGFYNAVLREEDLFSQRKVFFFVHLTIQELFAALYVYDCLVGKEAPTPELRDFLGLTDEERDLNVVDLLKRTVDKVMEKQHGHLDFFLRFLLGLMVEPNRRVLQGLLTPPDPDQETDKRILTYIKSIRRKTLSPDSCINLFQMIVEMRDHKVKDEIQEYLTLSDRSNKDLSPLHCSALAYMLQVSRDHLEVLDLKSYNTSEEGRRRLIPAVKISRKAILADCRVTPDWVEHLAFSLKFSHSALRDLDLSNNDLKDSGVELLCSGLSDQRCRLETLRLSGCQVTETGCRHLALALTSNPSHMKELDLSYNHPGPAGETLLTQLKEDPQNMLSTLTLEHGGRHRMKPRFLKYGCELTLDPRTSQQNVLLSEGNRKVTWVDHEQTLRPPQVLCEQGLRGRCYWEVRVSGPLGVGVTYRGAATNDQVDHFRMGHTDKSWILVCSTDGYCVQHNNERMHVSSCGWRSSWVGVYLDWPAGTLSFYRVSPESQVHLHTFRATFTEPLYPAVELQPQSSAILWSPV